MGEEEKVLKLLARRSTLKSLSQWESKDNAGRAKIEPTQQ
jgi:hypothetical protein